jgi:hypothetical protein
MGVGGRVEPRWADGRPRWFPPEFDWVVGCSYRGLPTERALVRNPIGANMSFRRPVLQRVGGFRAGLGRTGRRPVGCEETELAIRVRQRLTNALVLFEPAAVVRHRVSSARARPGYFFSRCFAEGRSKALVARHVGRRDGLASERRYVVRDLSRGVLDGIRDALRGNPAGGARALAILGGLTLTVAGYALCAAWVALSSPSARGSRVER